jgi:hypothetical protein
VLTQDLGDVADGQEPFDGGPGRNKPRSGFG